MNRRIFFGRLLGFGVASLAGKTLGQKRLIEPVLSLTERQFTSAPICFQDLRFHDHLESIKDSFAKAIVDEWEARDVINYQSHIRWLNPNFVRYESPGPFQSLILHRRGDSPSGLWVPNGRPHGIASGTGNVEDRLDGSPSPIPYLDPAFHHQG